MTIFDVEFRRQRPDATQDWVHSRGMLKRAPDGQPTHLIGVDLDVTEARTALAAAEQFTERLLETANVMVVGLDSDATIRIFNHAAEQITGWPRADVIGRSWFDTLVPSTRYPEVLQVFQTSHETSGLITEYENAVITPDGQQRQILWRNGQGVTPQGLNLTLCFGVDVTKQRNVEARLAHLALHDSLTGLPNRQRFNDRLERECARVARSGGLLAVHMIDLDHFKDVNDAFAHPTGDALLQAVGQRFEGVLRGSDTVARLGGDEFAILQVDVDSEAAASRLAHRLITALQAPIDCLGQPIRAAASIGITLCHGTQRPATLMQQADLALYQAKEAGRHRSMVFSPALNLRFTERTEAMQRLDEALDAGHLTAWYQPQLHLRDGGITSLEAVLHWREDQRGPAPSRLVELAEQSGRIVQLRSAVRTHAFDAMARWSTAGLQPPLSLEVATAELGGSTYATDLLHQIDRRQIHPTQLELTLSEATLLVQGDAQRANIERLTAAGVRFAIAGFGTGASSLQTLQTLPHWRLKIAPALVGDLHRTPKNADTVRATLAIARLFDQSVVAEGIEDAATRDALLTLGCNEGRGLWLAAPESEAHTTRVLQAR